MKINIKKLSKKQIITIIIIVVLLIILIPSGIYCGINNETPAQMLTDVFSSDETQIISKWQSDEAVSGYEFREDGTYDSYISTFSFTGRYAIDGNKITLTNPNSGSTVLYKFSINGDKLTMTLLEENGTEPDEKEQTVYKRVQRFNMKSITDILEEYANAENEETTKPE